MKNVIILTQLLIVLLLNGCTVSYKFNGASIDYTKTKTISVADFPNIAESVYPPLASTFTEALKDIYVRQTRLQLVKDGGDLQLERWPSVQTAILLRPNLHLRSGCVLPTM